MTDHPNEDMDRPNIHGKYLGEALALLAAAGRKVAGASLPEPCLTCAFRRGTMPNQSPGTGIVAMNCATGVDADEFACHHGMREGEPTRICAGYAAALLAPGAYQREVLIGLYSQIERLEGPDAVRADFDAWMAEVDPQGKMDVYQLGRAYAGKAIPHGR